MLLMKAGRHHISLFSTAVLPLCGLLRPYSTRSFLFSCFCFRGFLLHCSPIFLHSSQALRGPALESLPRPSADSSGLSIIYCFTCETLLAPQDQVRLHFIVPSTILMHGCCHGSGSHLTPGEETATRQPRPESLLSFTFVPSFTPYLRIRKALHI